MFQSREPQGNKSWIFQNMNPKAFHNYQSQFASADASHHLTTSSASQNWQISGVEHVGQKVVTRGWEAFCTEGTTVRVGWFRPSCVMLVLLLSFTPLRASSNRTIQHIPNIHTDDNFSCPIYFRNVFNTLKLSMSPNILVQVQHYTITQLYSTPNVCQFTKYVKICHVSAKVWDQVDLPKLTNWMISNDFEVIHSQVGQKFWPQWRPLQVDFVSSLIAQLQILRLMSKWPQGSKRFRWEEFSESFGEVCLETSGYFYCVCL